VFASFTCNSARAFSRVASRLLSIECNGSLSGNTVLGNAEEGSRAEEYTKSAESELELQKTTMVDYVRGHSALSDVSSSNTPSPLYIPPHRC